MFYNYNVPLPRIKIAVTPPTGQMPIRPVMRPKSLPPVNLPGKGVLPNTPFTPAGSAPKPAPKGLRPEDFGLKHFTPFTPPPGAGQIAAATPPPMSRITVPQGMSGTKFVPATRQSVFEAAAKAAPTGRAAVGAPVPMTHVDPFSGMEFAVKKGAVNVPASLARPQSGLVAKGVRLFKDIVDPRALPPELDRIEHAVQNRMDTTISRPLNKLLRSGRKIPRGISSIVQELIDSGSSILDASGHENTRLPSALNVLKVKNKAALPAIGMSTADNVIDWMSRNPVFAATKVAPTVFPVAAIPLAAHKLLNAANHLGEVPLSVGKKTTDLAKDFRVLKSLKDHIRPNV